MVGSLAILLLISIAKGVQSDVTNQVKDIGVNVLVVLPGRVEDGNFNPNLGGQSYLKEEDAVRLRSVPGVIRATTLTFTGGGVRAGKKDAYPVTIAAHADWFRMHPVRLDEGRLFTDADDLENVAVLGAVAKKALFGSNSALGQTVEINQNRYRVIGVTAEKKASGGGLFSMFGFENVVYVPFGAVKKSRPDMQIDRIMIQSAPEAEPKLLQRQLDAALGKRLDRQQYSVLTQEDLLGLVYKLMNILTWLLTGLTSIALFVGGVGIMTVMLMSVNERAKEIGIRKTVGARRADVFQQFLFESLFLSLLGGGAGLALSAVICAALDRLTPIHPLLSLPIIGLSFGVSIGVGAIFGLLPAMRAARKDPVVALRSE